MELKSIKRRPAPERKIHNFQSIRLSARHGPKHFCGPLAQQTRTTAAAMHLKGMRSFAAASSFTFCNNMPKLRSIAAHSPHQIESLLQVTESLIPFTLPAALTARRRVSSSIKCYPSPDAPKLMLCTSQHFPPYLAGRSVSAPRQRTSPVQRRRWHPPIHRLSQPSVPR
jgi:hypothetical protein